MKTFESKFEDYYVALGNAEQVRIYNHFAGANLCPFVYDSEDIDEVFENLTPKQIVNLVKKGDFESYHNWFYLNDKGYMQGIEIVPEWLDKYIPAMAKYYHVNQQVLLYIDADAIALFSDNEDDYVRNIFDRMTLDECIKMWNESACDHYMRLWKVEPMDNEDWWEQLGKEIGGYELYKAIRSARMGDVEYEFFFYDVDYNVIRPFNTKQEFISCK